MLLALALIGLVLPGQLLARDSSCGCGAPVVDTACCVACEDCAADDCCRSECPCPTCDADTRTPVPRERAPQPRSGDSTSTVSANGLVVTYVEVARPALVSGYLDQQNSRALGGPLQPLLCVWLA